MEWPNIILIFGFCISHPSLYIIYERSGSAAAVANKSFLRWNVLSGESIETMRTKRWVDPQFDIGDVNMKYWLTQSIFSTRLFKNKLQLEEIVMKS